MRILMSPGRAISNPYIGMLIDSLPPDVEVVPFSWRLALAGRFDVLHVHWPEALVVSGGRVRSALTRALFATLLTSIRALHKPTVATVHNRRPHEGLDGSARRLVSSFVRQSTRRIYLTRSSLEEAQDPRGVHINHGDYTPVIERRRTSLPAMRPGRLVVFGRMRPYKGIEDLVSAFVELPEPEASLHVAGEPLNDAYRRTLVEVTDDPRVQYTLRPLDEDELIDAVASSEAAVFPYREVFNSGAVIYALTLGRPVIVTRSASMEELQREAGESWVSILDHPLTSAQLADAVETLRVRADERASRDPLPGRTWDRISAQHAELYRSIALR